MFYARAPRRLLGPATNTKVLVQTLGVVQINLFVHWSVGSVSAENVDWDNVRAYQPDQCYVLGSGERSSLIAGSGFGHVSNFMSFMCPGDHVGSRTLYT